MNVEDNDENYEIIEMLNFNCQEYSNDKKENIEDLTEKLKSKLELLEELYKEKYIKKDKNINNQIILKEETLKKYKNEYIETLKYYRNELDNIRFHEDLITFNKKQDLIRNEIEKNNSIKNKLKKIRELDKFYQNCNKFIITKNERILDNKDEYLKLKNYFNKFVEEITNNFNLNVKSIETNIELHKKSLLELEIKKEKQININNEDFYKSKNQILNKNINLENKINQLKANKRYENIKKLENDKYNLDIDLNNKKILLLETQNNDKNNIILKNYTKEIYLINEKIITNQNEIEKEFFFKEDSINRKIQKIKNYEKYYSHIQNENKNLENKNLNLEKKISNYHENLKNYDLITIRLNNDFNNLIEQKNILIHELSKKYKYYINIYEEDLHDRKIKIYNINEAITRIKEMNIYDKDLKYIKDKISIIKLFLNEK